MSKREIIELVDSSDEDGDDREEEALRAEMAAAQKRLADIAAKRARKRQKLQGLTFKIPLSTAKLEKLKSIDNAANRRLQQLLWELSFDYELFDHQFRGVRALAGVSDDFPGEEMLQVHDEGYNRKSKARLEALKNAKLRCTGGGDQYGSRQGVCIFGCFVNILLVKPSNFTVLHCSPSFQTKVRITEFC